MPKASKNQCIKFPSKEEEAKTLVLSGFSYNQVSNYSGIPFEELSKIVNETEDKPKKTVHRDLFTTEDEYEKYKETKKTRHGGHYLLTDDQIECYEHELGKRRGLIKRLTHGFADKQRNEQLKQLEKGNKK